MRRRRPAWAEVPVGCSGHASPCILSTVRGFAVRRPVSGSRFRSFAPPALSEKSVEALMESMRQIGLINPIVICRPHGVSPVLVAGAHRLEAAIRLGWETIPCTVAPNKDNDALRLAEIDENLIRNDLSPAERAIHIQARKEIYERMHPETRNGASPGAGRGKGSRPLEGRQLGDLPTERFTKDTTRRTGVSERTIQRSSARSAPPVASTPEA